ncbi:MAG: hypothetical protein IKP76_03230 [Bacilli bacterium]|nr:hypothetical protein [Bacilli bacterium]
MKKIFGGLKLSWPTIIIMAVLIAVYTATMAVIPITKDTSFRDINATLEVWIFFGILIIMNSKSAKESALKCFVFFLISQPLIYLFQVPFSWQGWNLFSYYRFWFVITVLCLPMGYLGYHMKDNKWYGLIMLTPMLLLLGILYYGFLSEAYSFFPNHLLSAIFCASTMILYSLFIFDNKVLKIIETVISSILIIVLTVMVFATPKTTYHTTMFADEVKLTETTKVRLEDSKYGTVNIKYEDGLGEYAIEANFTKAGETKLIVEDDVKKCIYDLTIQRTSYDKKLIECIDKEL